MPQGPSHLHEKFGEPHVALAVLLSTRFSLSGGVISPRVQDMVVSDEEGDAIDYLVMEWDYAYNPLP